MRREGMHERLVRLTRSWDRREIFLPLRRKACGPRLPRYVLEDEIGVLVVESPAIF